MRPGLNKSISSATFTLIAIVKPRTYMVRLSAIITLMTASRRSRVLAVMKVNNFFHGGYTNGML